MFFYSMNKIIVNGCYLFFDLRRTENLMVNITINNISYKTDKNNTILKAASENGIDIPVFCNDRRLIPEASCRICLVEVEGAGKTITFDLYNGVINNDTINEIINPNEVIISNGFLYV